ncbi:MAG: MarR family transcriptional regulator, partial [Candidatus Bathyarchaeia archaeon]
KEALSDEEAEIIRFIRRRGGRVLEAELRENFPHIPRTSMWRLIKRLEKQGVVRVRKVGLQNVVELK